MHIGIINAHREMITIRNYLQQAVCSLIILTIISFFMIFVISLLLIENLHDNIKQYTPLTM